MATPTIPWSQQRINIVTNAIQAKTPSLLLAPYKQQTHSHRSRPTMRLASGHVAVQLEGEELAKIQRDFEGYSKGLVRLTPGRWVLPAPYTKFADKIYNTKVRFMSLWKKIDV